VVVVGGCSRDEAPPETVYRVAVRIADVPPEFRAQRSFLEQRRHVEWVDPASGRWRIESRGPVEPGSREIEDATFIFTGSACVDLVEYGPSIREGSRRFLGPCVEDSVAFEPLQRYVRAGREPPVRVETKRAGYEFLLAVEETITPAEAESRRLFEVPETHFLNLSRELQPGERPTLPIRAYWLGPRIGARRALTTVEHRLGGEMGYTAFYVPASAGDSSHAYPGLDEYPAGEVQVTSSPLTDPIARKERARLQGEHAAEIALANGERARLLPGFRVRTKTTLVSLSGPIPKKRIRALAVQLRPL
jgi:hypothetical protein